MTWARSLPSPARRAAAALLHALREAAADVGAIGPDDPRGRRFGRFGQGSVLAFPQGTIYNERFVQIGSGTMIGPQVCLTAGMAPGQAMASDPVVRIGDRCVIGRGSHVVGHWSIEIGDDVQTGPYVYVTDQNHSYVDPGRPVGTQWPVEAPVRIGAGSWLGAHVVVLPGSDIGDHVVVAAGAVVRGKLPDRCVAGGVPARVLRRWFPGRGWVDVRDDDGPGAAGTDPEAALAPGLAPGFDPGFALPGGLDVDAEADLDRQPGAGLERAARRSPGA